MTRDQIIQKLVEGMRVSPDALVQDEESRAIVKLALAQTGTTDPRAFEYYTRDSELFRSLMQEIERDMQNLLLCTDGISTEEYQKLLDRQEDELYKRYRAVRLEINALMGRVQDRFAEGVRAHRMEECYNRLFQMLLCIIHLLAPTVPLRDAADLAQFAIKMNPIWPDDGTHKRVMERAEVYWQELITNPFARQQQRIDPAVLDMVAKLAAAARKEEERATSTGQLVALDVPAGSFDVVRGGRTSSAPDAQLPQERDKPA